jgi:hypothetical protein
MTQPSASALIAALGAPLSPPIAPLPPPKIGPQSLKVASYFSLRAASYFSQYAFKIPSDPLIVMPYVAHLLKGGHVAAADLLFKARRVELFALGASKSFLIQAHLVIKGEGAPHVKAQGLEALTLTHLQKPTLFFPTIAQANEMTLQELHTTWANNLATLIGFLARERLPLIGFHGTPARGLVGIQKDKGAKGVYPILWVAAIGNRVDPVTDLCSLFSIVRKAWGYASDLGGVFVIDAHKGSLACARPITGEEITPSNLDSSEEGVFLKAVRDNQNGWELVVTVQPHSYSSLVEGVIPNSDTLYPKEGLYPFLYTTDQLTFDKGKLMQRLKMQEFLVKSFRFLNLSKWNLGSLQNYNKAGRAALTAYAERRPPTPPPPTAKPALSAEDYDDDPLPQPPDFEF